MEKQKDYAYMFCQECGDKVMVEYCEDVVVIHCPMCTGECNICKCYLHEKCFSDAKNVVLKEIHIGE